MEEFMEIKSFFNHYRKIVLVLLFLCIIMTIYLIFTNKSFSKPLIVNIDPNDIVVDSTLPISDTLGKSIEKNKLQSNIQGYVEISKALEKKKRSKRRRIKSSLRYYFYQQIKI